MNRELAAATSGADRVPPVRTRSVLACSVALLVGVVITAAALPSAAHGYDDGDKNGGYDGHLEYVEGVIWTSAVDGCLYELLLRAEARGTSLDIGLVGSSLTFRGMHAAQIADQNDDPDVTVLNAAMPGKPLDVVRWWTENVVVPLARPDVLVIGIASRDLILGGQQQREARAAFLGTTGRDFVQRGDLDFALDAIAAGDRVPAYRAALRRPDLVTQPLSLGWDPVAAGYEPPGWQLRGLWPSNCLQARDREHDVFTGSTADERARLADNQLTPYDLAPGLEQLRGLVRTLQRNETTPVLVNLPVTPDYRAAHPGGEATYDAYRETVADLARQEGILLIDAVEFFPVEWGLFRDMSHLNVWGAHRLSRRLGVILNDPDAARVICLRCG
jgi:hypothetical protein